MTPSGDRGDSRGLPAHAYWLTDTRAGTLQMGTGGWFIPPAEALDSLEHAPQLPKAPHTRGTTGNPPVAELPISEVSLTDGPLLWGELLG